MARQYVGVVCKVVDVSFGYPFDFVFHRWYTGIVMEGFITYVQGSVEGYTQYFGLYSLQDFRVRRLGTAPDLYPITKNMGENF